MLSKLVKKIFNQITNIADLSPVTFNTPGGTYNPRYGKQHITVAGRGKPGYEYVATAYVEVVDIPGASGRNPVIDGTNNEETGDKLIEAAHDVDNGSNVKVAAFWNPETGGNPMPGIKIYAPKHNTYYTATYAPSGFYTTPYGGWTAPSSYTTFSGGLDGGGAGGSTNNSSVNIIGYIQYGTFDYNAAYLYTTTYTSGYDQWVATGSGYVNPYTSTLNVTTYNPPIITHVAETRTASTVTKNPSTGDNPWSNPPNYRFDPYYYMQSAAGSTSYTLGVAFPGGYGPGGLAPIYQQKVSEQVMRNTKYGTPVTITVPTGGYVTLTFTL